MEIKNNYLKKMKLNNKWFMAITMLLLPLFFLASCKKAPEQFNKALPTVFQYISANKQLSLYQAALKRAGMYNADTFSNGGPFTVFAPVDSAFISVGLTLDSINRYDPQALSLVLKYSIVYGEISSSSLVGFYSEDAFSLNPTYKPRIAKNYYGIFLDGIPLVNGGSIDLGDGVVHELRRLAFPPTGNLFEMISKSPDLTFFTAALKRIGYDTKISAAPVVPSYVTGDGALYWTVFAPTNNAYKVFGYPDIASINNADPSQLQMLINTYVIQGQKLLTSGFMGGFPINNNAFYIDTDGFTIETKGNVSPTHIIRPDIIATNGVLQVVDQVIVPFNQ
jgi:uncharacterized surface protein with fasciclin (FAS1) repeats